MTIADSPVRAPRSELNADVVPARPGEFAMPSIGPIAMSSPVVLAPMAGVTDVPFRELCRRFGAGIYVNQMITARGWLSSRGGSKVICDGFFAPKA